MSTLKTPFRYDFVGSFLRPQALKDAKTKYQNNDITKDEYDKIYPSLCLPVQVNSVQMKEVLHPLLLR